MKQELINYLATIEKAEEFDIFFCAVGGSRNYGYDRIESDYDIWFIYDGKSSKIGFSFSYDNITMEIHPISREKYEEELFKGFHYFIDNLRSNNIIIDKYNYYRSMKRKLVTLPRNYVLDSLVETGKNKYNQWIKDKETVRVKYYIQGILCVLKYFWIRRYKTIFYPINIFNLLETFSKERWSGEVRHLLTLGNAKVKRFSNIDKLFEVL